MVQIETLANGLTVILEQIPNVESVAYELQIPGGIILDNESAIGASLVLAELTSRGAGTLGSRDLSDAFENRGIRHGESAGHDRFVYRGLLLSEHLDEALRLVSLMVREPTLPEQEIDNIRNILQQDIASLADDPARRSMVELFQRYYPAPFGRPGHGSAEGIASVTAQSLRKEWEKLYRPKGAVLSIAGNIEPDKALAAVVRHFGAWTGTGAVLPRFGALPPHKTYHINFESAQLQVVLAYPSAPFGDPHYYTAKIATGVLSGGMFGRLFVEVREKRGLCYSVYARHAATQEYGSVIAYAGTTPERAHETLEVMLRELRALRGSVSDEELSRARANLLSALIMGEESTAARAGSNAGDWWISKRVRPLDEIRAGIDAVTRESIDRFEEKYPAQSCMILTLGSKEIATADLMPAA